MLKVPQTRLSSQDSFPVASKDVGAKHSPPSFKDRVSQQEAMICAFIAQHTLHLDLAPHLVKLAQALSSDHKALQTLSMERFSTTYKLKHGLHEVTRKRIVNKMKMTPFSINLDEATSNSNKKRVLNILVCFFDADLENTLACLLDDIHKDFVYSPDIKEHFFAICKILGLPPKQPKERVGHRWLSLFDSSQSFEELADPLTILYFSWLSVQDKVLYQKKICDIYVKHQVSASGRHAVMAIMSKLKEKVKGMSVLGKNRKERVCHKLFDKRIDIELLTKAITSIFPMFKKFILTFETKKPMVHKLYDEVTDLFRTFLKGFIKAQDLRESGKKLMEFDVSDKDKHLNPKHVAVVFKLQRYPSVEKVVTACLSIFSGPRVEQSFSIMNHIITSKTSSLNIKTYEAILCVKYMLLAQNTTAIKLYSRSDAVFSL
ncbi:hypothetical protein RRG08_025515 [Elysia crispata]|uniref:HAT C-terminal dimerisation domain-containing protein n=1 Tax=Elysia crispata TaxID=231223 RepID=A0AAE1A1H7_9GAST|nr:hypothetical protein RRG08_025515 [Elysia crispata]